MIKPVRKGFAHRTHPRARRRLLVGERSAGRAGPAHGQTRLSRHAVDVRAQITS